MNILYEINEEILTLEQIKIKYPLLELGMEN